MAETVIAAAGSLVTGAASYEAGRYNKKVSEQNAISAEREGAAEVARIRTAARAAMGQQIGAQASNGFQIGTGSALDALTESQINATMDALNVRREAASRATAARVSGAQAMAAGENAFTAGMIGAAKTVYDYKADWAGPKSGTTSGGSGSSDIVVNSDHVRAAIRRSSSYGG